MTSPPIGIDLGTTYSCVAVWRQGKVEVIANDQGNRTTPSCVAFNETERLIGDAAKSQMALNPTNTVFDVKRLIGRKFSDPCVQSDLSRWPFRVINEDGRPTINVTFMNREKLFAPEEISAMILYKMKETAETYLGGPVSEAVVTVPAYFKDTQRQATKDAGIIAGLKILRIINEPTAAALAYGLDSKANSKKNILIFDLGGGTFDVTILRKNEDGTLFEVKATAGDTHLGGEDFDNRLVDYMVDEIHRKYKRDISNNKRAIARLKAAAEKAKRILSSSTEANIDIDALYDGIDFYTKISRARFEELCLDLFKQTLKPVDRALYDAKMDKTDIDDVILVGGSTRIPRIRSILRNHFDGKQLNCSINADEAVACGAAVQAAMLSGELAHTLQNVLLVDVSPLSLGIETAGGIMSKIIERNTKIPCTEKQMFTTFADNQRAVTVQIYEGERSLTKDNNLLGKFDLVGIPPAPHGVPQIEVSFDIDENGILKVSAKDILTGKNNTIELKNETGRLSKQEIKRMLSEAQKYKLEDEKQKQRITARHSLESYAFSIRQYVEDIRADSLSETEKAQLRHSAQVVITWIDNHLDATAEQYKHHKSELEKFCQPILKRVGT